MVTSPVSFPDATNWDAETLETRLRQAYENELTLQFYGWETRVYYGYEHDCSDCMHRVVGFTAVELVRGKNIQYDDANSIEEILEEIEDRLKPYRIDTEDGFWQEQNYRNHAIGLQPSLLAER